MPNLKKLAKEFGTPLLIIDHNIIRRQYKALRKHLPRIGLYYAIKANPEVEIIQTLAPMNSGYDVASYNEFLQVIDNVPDEEKKDYKNFIYDKIILANTIKPIDTLKKLANQQTLMTFDNPEELRKIKKYCPDAGLICRIKVANVGSVVELSSKFGVEPGNAVNLISSAFNMGLSVEGISFHVGSQCLNIDNYVNALNASSEIFKEVGKREHQLRLLNIGGGFPVPYDSANVSFKQLAEKLRKEIDRLFPKKIEIVAEPGRFMVAESATLVVEIIGKSDRDGKTVYYVNDGVYGTLSGVIFDHIPYHFNSFKRGARSACAVVGPTCDAFDSISTSEMLPNLSIGDLLYVKNIGAYSSASATNFNGFDKAKILHINT
ncbi:type III PLP-dependent enzyme [Candidatus Saganbacteria bacterium]|nr:type III PLP-dependent enzyme [Candidatus Saganbacteria bacterium]